LTIDYTDLHRFNKKKEIKREIAPRFPGLFLIIISNIDFHVTKIRLIAPDLVIL